MLIEYLTFSLANMLEFKHFVVPELGLMAFGCVVSGFGFLLEELKSDKSSYTYTERKNTFDEDGNIILYDYDCLDKITSLSIENDANDGAPIQRVEILQAVVLEENIEVNSSKYIK